MAQLLSLDQNKKHQNRKLKNRILKFFKVAGEEVWWMINPPTHIIVYLAANAIALFFWVYFRLFYIIKIYGWQRLRWQRNTIVYTNHQSMIDSFLIGPLLLWPKTLLRPSLIPVHLPAKENFFEPRIFSRFFRYLARKQGYRGRLGELLQNSFIERVGNISTDAIFTLLFLSLNCYPVREGRDDPQVLKRVYKTLPNGLVHVFATAGRDPEGCFKRVSRGIGVWVAHCQPTIVPIYFEGMQDVLPKKKLFPRFFKKIRIQIGEPFMVDGFYPSQPLKDVHNHVIGVCTDKLRELQWQIKKDTSF